MKVLTVVGARPQFVKAAAVSRALVAQGTTEILVHTGQHYDDNMSEAFFRELNIPAPTLNLGIGGGNHGAQTGRMMQALEDAVLQHNPDWVLVYGDTNSTMAGALVAAKLHTPIAHVEAGLRSFDRKMPEEVNRVVTDHVSSLLFAPTQVAVNNLKNEGLGNVPTVISGDVMYDVALHYAAQADETSRALQTYNLNTKNFVLATVHRAENTDNLENLNAVFGGLNQVAQSLPVVLPLHPRTASALKTNGLDKAFPNITFTEPLGYLDMLSLLKHAAVVATDSGGVQKEAFFQSTPCVTLRTTTEWTELLDSGWNRLQPPTSPQEVALAILSTKGTTGQPMQAYGTGNAATIIAQALNEAKA